MELHELESWAEFRPLVQGIRDEYGQRRSGDERLERNTILFRGHADADWPLSSTLERFTDEHFSVERYLMHASLCADELESLTGKTWKVPVYEEIDAEIKAKQRDSYAHLPCHEYLSYLRHNGFPSPLLDWTESPFIAAYYAYVEKRPSERVAVHAYVAKPDAHKDALVGKPQMRVVGPCLNPHGRHGAQRAVYTIATKYDQAKGRHSFCRHESVFESRDENQDLLVKITMPRPERLRALRDLSDFKNINHFRLFQSEDAAVRALAMRTLELARGVGGIGGSRAELST